MIPNIKTKVFSGILALSLFTTSFGGAFATSAYATEAQEKLSGNDAVNNDKLDKGIVTGLVAVGLIAALSNHGDGDSPSSNSSPTKSSTPSTSSAADEQQALTLLNQDRAKNGLSALKANSQLTTVARNYAKDMINRGYFSHYSPEGQSPFDRINKAGISYKTAGENIGSNTSVVAAETAFMNSSGHRANILNSDYTEVGIGVVRTSSGQVYVVQDFIGK